MTTDGTTNVAATDENQEENLTSLVEFFSEGGTIKTLSHISEEELEAVYSVGFNYFSAQKYDKAIDVFKFLCLYDHTEPRWYHALGIAQQKSGQFDAAIQSYALATILDIEDPRPQIQAGYCLMAKGMWREASDALEASLGVCKDYPERVEAGVKEQAEALLASVKEKLAGKGDK